MTTLSFPAIQEDDVFMCRGTPVFSDMTFGRVYQVMNVLDGVVHWLDDRCVTRTTSADFFHGEFKLGGFEVGDTVMCIDKPDDSDYSYNDTHIGRDYKIRTVKDDVGYGYIEWVDSVNDFPEDTIANFSKYFKLVARMGNAVEPPTAVTYEAKPSRQLEMKPVDMALSLITLAMHSRGIELTTTQADSLMDVMTVYARGLMK